MKINEITHPDYMSMQSSWYKWRLTYNSGDSFVTAYLKQYSNREDAATFSKRKDITYVPAFAKAAINDVRNAIFQRANDIKRIGGSITYKQATTGQLSGVDLNGSTINAFMGLDVLSELLVMARVGIYINMPAVVGETLADVGTEHPYLYIYKVEDIRSWEYGIDNKLTKLLLRGYKVIEDPQTKLPIRREAVYRYFIKLPTGITVEEYNKDGVFVTRYTLLLENIPFIMPQINQSLMEDIAGYQIGLLNLASSDINYAITANFPFYTEQYDQRAEAMSYLRQARDADSDADDATPVDGTAETAQTANEKQITLGVTQGRRYTQGTERPGFIHPSPEPLRVSMDKQEIMKKEIRELINLSLANISSRMVGADSREMENEGLEAGLAAIGLILESSERQIAEFWHEYEGKESDVIINYPKLYSLKSDKERLDEADKKYTLINKIPSLVYKKEMAKDIAQLTLGHRTSPDKMDMILKEIDSAVSIIDVKTVFEAKEAALISGEFADTALGIPASEAKKGAEDHADRLERIAIAQSIAKPDTSDSNDDNPDKNPTDDAQVRKDRKTQSQNADTSQDGIKRIRGKGRRF